MPDFDFGDAGNKLLQLGLFSSCFHNSPFGKVVARKDGTFCIVNQYLATRLNAPEAAFDAGASAPLTIHDLVQCPPDDEIVDGFAKPSGEERKHLEGHPEWFSNWFDWPVPLTLESRGRKPFVIWGWDESGSLRIPHDCVVSVRPVYAREHDKMIAVKGGESIKTLLAFASVVFLDDFKSFAGIGDEAPSGCPVKH